MGLKVKTTIFPIEHCVLQYVTPVQTGPDENLDSIMLLKLRQYVTTFIGLWMRKL